MNRRLEAVVIGGSAGAIEVLVRLLERLPASFALMIAIVVHLPRRGRSDLAGLLSAHCALPVCEAQDKEPAVPGAVFVASADYHLLLDRGPRFSLSLDAPVNHSRPSIDVLFASAADQYGPRLAGLVLSGANEDGARGLLAISRAGGLAWVQEPAEARSRTMPEAALALCETAHALRVEALVERLCACGPEGSDE